MSNGLEQSDRPDEAVTAALVRVTRRYGTPTYAFDVGRIRDQTEKLRRHLPSEVEILYSLKANASLGICDVLADCGVGADVASAGELATALQAGFPPERVFVAGPFKLPETVAMLRETPQAILSVDSLSELRFLAAEGLRNRIVFRLRPDFDSHAVVRAGSECRFGLTHDDLQRCRDELTSCDFDVIGFHVFAGSQVLDAEKLNEKHLRLALDLSQRAADVLGISPTFMNLGGGFGTPYGPKDQQLDLARVGEELARLVERAAPARLVLELGRYFVAEAGYYLVSVLGHQTYQGRAAVVVDGGVHQRADMCGMGLRSNQNPPIPLGVESTSLRPTAVLGCLSLPDDVMLDGGPLPELSAGDVLAFANAGAYGLWSSPAMFHSSPLPAEVAFDGSELHLMRERQPAQSILKDQNHVLQRQEAAPS
jgi:diaminopimelate decarboxylase